MKELIVTLTTGLNGKILFGVIIFIIFVYVPYLFFYLRKRRAKQETFEFENKDFIKVYLELDLVGTLTVYSINGEEPSLFYETTRQGFYLFPGKSKIGVQYHMAQIDAFSVTGYKNTNIKPKKLKVYAEKSRTYSLGYNINEDKYEFNEIKATL